MRVVAMVLIRGSLATVVGLGALFCSVDVFSERETSIMPSAQARVGRPLTPMSYAGVARRTTRRAVAVGAATAGAVAVGAAACRQVVDAYGQVVRVCP